MEKDSGSWFHQQHLHLPSPNLNLLLRPFEMGQLNNEPVARNPYFVDDSRSRNDPLFPVPGLQQSKASEPYNSSTWYCQVPHSNQAFTPGLNSASIDKFSADPVFRQQATPNTGTALSRKRFLVFDKSGDETTLVYSSGVENTVQCGNFLVPKPSTAYNLSKEWPGNNIHFLKPITNYEFREEKSRVVTEDEMHEDTEELDALLCSDSDSYSSEEDEETSTGHSPSTMTDERRQDLIEETGEEVVSFYGPTKRQKLLGGCYDPLSLGHTASFVRKSASSVVEDDAESSCGNYDMPSIGNLGSPSSGGKRLRKYIICEKLRLLQSIIPNVNGKEACVVIDEAIRYH